MAKVTWLKSKIELHGQFIQLSNHCLISPKLSPSLRFWKVCRALLQPQQFPLHMHLGFHHIQFGWGEMKIHMSDVHYFEYNTEPCGYGSWLKIKPYKEHKQSNVEIWWSAAINVYVANWLMGIGCWYWFTGTIWCRGSSAEFCCGGRVRWQLTVAARD